MSRQNFYARRQQRQRRQVDGDLIVQLVRVERQTQPRIGTRKLHRMLAGALAAAGVVVGRDRLFAALRARDLLVPPLPATWPKTTLSAHALPVFTNLIKDRTVQTANEVWVSDLTYVRTDEGFLYLALTTDRYSRKIVGYHAGETLAAAGCLQALEMALRNLPAGRKPTHHSDRGSQYCCHEYVGRLQARELAISMTEENHCAENALAERMNGILKQEYGLGGGFANKVRGRKAIDQAVYLYNHRRPHTALNYQMPAVVHRQAEATQN